MVLLKTKIHFTLFLYLGVGTLSSGTAVQTESGVFCSLNRPLNTFSMSSMLNAQTADPGILKKGKTIRKTVRPQRAYSWVPPARTEVFWVVRDVFSPVELCGEHPDHRGDAIDLHYICNRLQDIEVEKRIPGDGAVKPSLQKRSPVFLQDPLGATHVVLTYAGHTGIDSLPEGQSRGRGGEWKPKLLCVGGTRKAKDVSGSEESSSLLSREQEARGVN